MLLTQLYIIKPSMNTAKPFGSKLIDSHNSYKTFLTNNNPVFNQRMKKIGKRDLTAIEQLEIFEHRNQPSPHLFYFNAQRYESNLREGIEEYVVREIDYFMNNYNSSFAIVYVHASIFDFLAFRRFVEKWPEHFFHRLRKVYIVGASVMVRLVETFSVGTFYRLCDEIFANVASENAVKEIDAELLKEIGEGVQKSESYKDSIKVIENSLYGKTIDQYDLVSGRYPRLIVDLLARLLKDNGRQLKTQGIFRKNCDSEQLQRLQHEIINEEPHAIQNQQDIFVVAGCLKKILNNLRLPLFNYKIYADVINYQSGDEGLFVRKVLGDMDYVNFKVFVLLTVFLKEFVIQQKEINKMNAYNLAVIFGPCFFRPKEYDLKDLIYSGKFAKILMTVFEHPEGILEKAEVELAMGTLKGLAETP